MAHRGSNATSHAKAEGNITGKEGVDVPKVLENLSIENFNTETESIVNISILQYQGKNVL